MYYIFLDTNIIHHTLTYFEKENLIGLHKLNADFYNTGNLYILPQVITELNEFNENIFNFRNTTYLFVDSFNVQILNDAQESYMSFFDAAIYNNLQLLQTKITGYETYIADTIFFLESMHPGISISSLWIINFFKEIEGINYNQQSDYNPTQAIANVIECTGLGDMTYRNFTYRDIFRSTGNFMFDYKNFKNRNEDKKLKVGKDAQVICELVMWMDFLKSIPVDGNIIFISSDYAFVKEIKKFQTDCLAGKILESEHYTGFSKHYIFQLKNVMENLKVIKLDIKTFLFEGNKGSSHKIQEVI